MPEYATPSVDVFLVNLQNNKKGYLHNRAGEWPYLLNAGSQAVNNMPEKLKTIGYYDVVNFARQITVPGFY